MNRTCLNVALLTLSLVGAFALGTLCQNGDRELRAGCADSKPAQTLWTPATMEPQPISDQESNKLRFSASQFRAQPSGIEQESRCDIQDGIMRYQMEWDDAKQQFVFLGAATTLWQPGSVLNSFNSPLDRAASIMTRLIEPR